LAHHIWCGVGASERGIAIRFSRDNPPPARRCSIGIDQLDHVIPANTRSDRDAAQAAEEKHHPIKSMAAWMIGRQFTVLGVGAGVVLARKTAH
jgi:hypothetical protein